MYCTLRTLQFLIYLYIYPYKKQLSTRLHIKFLFPYTKLPLFVPLSQSFWTYKSYKNRRDLPVRKGHPYPVLKTVKIVPLPIVPSSVPLSVSLDPIYRTKFFSVLLPPIPEGGRRQKNLPFYCTQPNRTVLGAIGGHIVKGFFKVSGL